ncbi:MAG: efflux RND transporter periplasmic adaptor subunit [Tannerellaceae bacterium]
MKKIYLPIAALLFMAACNTPAPADAPTANTQTTEAADTTTTTDMATDSASATNDQYVDGISGATAMANHASFNGTMIAPPSNRAIVTLTMGGIVHTVTLLPGSYVKKGTVIATLKNPDFIKLQQDYMDARAQVEYLETEYLRQQRLSAEEAASQKRFQQSKADYLSMKSRLEAAAAQLTLLGMPAAELVKKGIHPYLEIKAPLDGYVVGTPINPGQYLNAGDPLCDIINKSGTLLRLTAYEKDLDNLKEGSHVQFRVNGMGEEVFEAILISIGQQIDEVSRSLEVYARVSKANPRFRPGMYVSARVAK